MKLLTKAIEKKLPALYTNEKKAPKDTKVIVKFFNPVGAWTWYATEGEKQEDGDWLFYGYVRGFEGELGYFTLNELKSVKLAFGLGIERDMYFNGCTLQDVMDGKMV